MATSAPTSLPIRKALDQNDALARLSQRVLASRQRMDDVAGLLPAALRALVKPGPIDADGWTLLAANAAVAAKLRQMVPALEAHLALQGWPRLPLRIKILAAE